MPRGDPVDGIGIVRYADAVSSQLCSKSYRPGTGDLRGFLQRRYLLGQILGPVDGRLPEPLPLRRVERGEDLATPAVEHRQRRTAPGGLLDPPCQGVEGADAPRRQPQADAEATRGRDPDPDAGEGPRAEADPEQVDRPPTASGGGRLLDLRQQPGRVQGPSLRGETQLRLVQDLAVAPGAGDGVDRRGIEADDDQRSAIP